MNPFYALGVSVLVGGLGVAIMTVLWKSAQKAFVTEQAAHAETSSKLLASQSALAISEGGRFGEKVRLEAIIALQKKELEETVHSSDPEAQRARLEKLSGG